MKKYALEPWFKIAEHRKEVKEGRSLNANRFAIQLEPVTVGIDQDDCEKSERRGEWIVTA